MFPGKQTLAFHARDIFLQNETLACFPGKLGIKVKLLSADIFTKHAKR